MLAIPNTTLQDPVGGAGGFTEFGGTDLIAGGFFVVANNPAEVQMAVRQEGSMPQWGGSIYCPPGVYPVARGQRQPVAGVRARNFVAGSPAQFFGSFFYPGEAQVLAGTPFDSTVAAGGGVTPPGGSGAMTPIDDQTLALAAASISLTADAGYAHLLLVLSGRGTSAVTLQNIMLRFNGDSGGNYDHEQFYGDGAAAAAALTAAQTEILLGPLPSNNSPAGAAGHLEALIPDYAGTIFHKSVSVRGASRYDVAAMRSSRYGGNWRSTAAIALIDLFPSAGNFAAGTRATLYGLAV